MAEDCGYAWNEIATRTEESTEAGHCFLLIFRAIDLSYDESAFTPSEWQRASKFIHASDKCSFLGVRFALRKMLKLPVDCGWTYGPMGKPSIDGAVQFSIAHSRGICAVAIGRNEPLGVDLEGTKEKFRDRGLLSRFLHEREREFLAAAENSDRFELDCLRCWTRKEAVVKAIGSGLTDDTKHYDTKLSERAPLLSIAGELRLIDFRLEQFSSLLSLALPTDIHTIDIWEQYDNGRFEFETIDIDELHK
jgi:4'-phosphopantetheinyl transferase